MRILYFAPVYYDDMKQRPQQIAECLAEKHELYYIEPTVSLLRWLLKGGRTYRGRKRNVHGRIKVIRLNGALTFHKSVEILDVCGINNWPELLQIRKYIKKCDLVWVGYSGWYTLVRHIRHKPVIFDKMDEEDLLVSSRLLKMTLRRDKQKMAEIADAVTVTCQMFYDEMKRKRKKVFLVPNAVPQNFGSGKPEPGIRYGDLGQIKTFGYVGTIGEWFDDSVVYKLLELDAGFEIVLVGKNYMPKIKNPRVHYLGVMENSRLPEIIQTFDICLYNFKKGPLLDSINPVKIYEYLALNKPVLAVKSIETEKLQEYLALYDRTDEIGHLIRTGMKRPFLSEQERKRFLSKNSWSERAGRIKTIIREVCGELS